MGDKDVICTYDVTDVGISFFRRLFWKEVCVYVGNVWVKWRRRLSVWSWKVLRGREKIFVDLTMGRLELDTGTQNREK